MVYEWVSAPEAAAMLGVSRRTIYRLAAAGTLRHLSDPLRFPRAEIAAFIDARLNDPPAGRSGAAAPRREKDARKVSKKVSPDSADSMGFMDSAAVQNALAPLARRARTRNV